MSNYMYAIICRTHGEVELSESQYEEQLSRPESLWICPICGHNAEWDDNCQCTSHPFMEVYYNTPIGEV